MYKTIAKFATLSLAAQQRLLSDMHLFGWESERLKLQAGLPTWTAETCCEHLLASIGMVLCILSFIIAFSNQLRAPLLNPRCWKAIDTRGFIRVAVNEPCFVDRAKPVTSSCR